MNSLQLPDTTKIKSFFEKTEGTTGMVGIVVGGIIGTFVLFKALPFILIALETAIGILGAVLTLIPLALLLVLLLKIISDKKLHKLAWYAYKSACWWFTDAAIRALDPIVVAKQYVAKLKARRKEIEGYLAVLAAEFRKLESKITKIKAEYDTAMEEGQKAHAGGKKLEFAMQARRAGRREETTITYEDLKRTAESMLRMLRRYYEVTGFIIEDTEDDVKVKEDRRNTIRAAHGAMTRIRSILQGDPDDLEIFERALYIVNEENEQKYAEILVFADMSKDFIENLDVENGIYEATALERFKEFEAKAESLLLPPGEIEQIVRTANDDSIKLDPETVKVSEPTVRNKPRYADLLKG